MRWIPLIALLVFVFCRGFIAATTKAPLDLPPAQTVRSEVPEVTAFEEISPPEGDACQHFAITFDNGERVVVKVKSALIEDWATKTIKSKFSW